VLRVIVARAAPPVYSVLPKLDSLEKDAIVVLVYISIVFIIVLLKLSLES